jgi:hypothetical protein
LISYEKKKSKTTFIQLLRIEKFKNKINIIKKTQKREEKKSDLNLNVSEAEKRKEKINS